MRESPVAKAEKAFPVNDWKDTGPPMSGTPTQSQSGLKVARHMAAWVAAIAVILFVALVVQSISAGSGMRHLVESSEHRLDVVAAALEGELARFQYLPSLLDTSPSVFRLLESPTDTTSQDEVNKHLHLVNDTAGSTTLYVLSLGGDCLASSDWNEPGTPFGTNLAFRPYMRDALAQGRGRFFGVGITSKRAGYYLSYALYQNGRVRGVATVKVSLEKTEQAWSKLPGNVLMFDERGVVILASQASWRYRPLLPLSAQALAEIATARPYGNEALAPLTWKARDTVSEDAQVVSLDGREYVATTRQLKDFGWQLRVLDDTAPVRAAARNAALLAALAMAVLWLLAVNQWQRQRALRHRVANQRALQVAYDSLESKVADRTAELSAAHSSLLRMQSERMHASKMVALGQMSAGLVHELNQPLAALRTLSDNACVLLERDQLGDVRSNLQRIGLLVDRLGGVTYQLKAFAHKTDRPRSPVSLQQVIANAQFLVSQRLREHGIEVEIDVSPVDLSAMADAARLEQVIVNLMGNAIDAMASAPIRHLIVEAKLALDHCVIAVTDTGAGIREDILLHLFEPFNTSKPAGTGLGLGLMISAHIVAEFEGRLTAKNIEAGGARFVIELPLPVAKNQIT